MADFEIIEADFQQYYNLDVGAIKFRRYARLLVNLPPESRFITKYSPFRDWNWDREMQAQILYAIDSFAVLYANAHRKKGTQKAKPPKLMQPDYAENAKKEIKKQKREKAKSEQAELAEIFAKRNSNVMEEK